MKSVFMFPGQGSQYYQMARQLFDKEPAFKESMTGLDELVKVVLGQSVINDMYDEKRRLFDPFITLRLTHPAIFMVECSMARLLQKKGINPDYVIGCSMGEFAAAVVAGVLSAEEALRMILNQALSIEEHCAEGRLIAVLNSASVYHQNFDVSENCSMAALNAPEQFVVAGTKAKLDRVKTILKSSDILHQELMVPFGFHSAAIDGAREPFLATIKNQTFRKPTLQMISGISGELLSTIGSDYFWRVVRETTLFAKGIKTIDETVSPEEELMFIDLGSGSLANLIKYNVRDSERSKGFQIVSPFQQELKKVEELHATYREKNTTITLDSMRSEPFEVFVFPGQGSQRKGMGTELFDVFPDLLHRANEILGYSLKELCLEDPARNLNKTQYTQPALYVVNALSYLKLKKDSGKEPDYVAGHSLGEYNALLAAGVFSFETGLRLVKKRGELMATMREGGMAAVKGLSYEEIKNVIDRYGLHELDLANFNTQNQIVISGPSDLISKSGSFFEKAGASLYFPLNVNGAFHSRYMKPAQDEFEKFLRGFSFSEPRIPVVSNLEASFYRNDTITYLLCNQLTNPVQWTNSINFLLNKGEVKFTEVGPGDVLTKLIWRIQQDVSEVVR